MASNLSSIPTGTNVLIDAYIFVYGLTAQSVQCKAFLERCSNEEVFGITLFEVVHEATHVFMVGEGRAKGWYTSAGARYLADHPQQVKTLSDYWWPKGRGGSNPSFRKGRQQNIPRNLQKPP